MGAGPARGGAGPARGGAGPARGGYTFFLSIFSISLKLDQLQTVIHPRIIVIDKVMSVLTFF